MSPRGDGQRSGASGGGKSPGSASVASSEGGASTNNRRPSSPGSTSSDAKKMKKEEVKSKTAIYILLHRSVNEILVFEQQRARFLLLHFVAGRQLMHHTGILFPQPQFLAARSFFFVARGQIICARAERKNERKRFSLSPALKIQIEKTTARQKREKKGIKMVARENSLPSFF